MIFKKRVFLYCFITTTFLLLCPIANSEPALKDLTIQKFATTLAEPNPLVEAGATTAMVAAMSASLCAKIAALNSKHHMPGNWLVWQTQALTLQKDLLKLMQQDVDTFNKYLKLQHSKNQIELAALQKKSAAIPMQIKNDAEQVKKIAIQETTLTNSFYTADGVTAIEFAKAAVNSAAALIKADA